MVWHTPCNLDGRREAFGKGGQTQWPAGLPTRHDVRSYAIAAHDRRESEQKKIQEGA